LVNGAVAQNSRDSTVLTTTILFQNVGIFDGTHHSYDRPMFWLAGKEAGNTLMRGFTSVRDMTGPAFGLKRATDTDPITGPRIWPSGAMISQTSGHGDFQLPY
jgi:hypothetical protein